MKVTKQMINPELRRRGKISKLFLRMKYNKRTCDAFNAVLRFAQKGKCFSKLNYSQEYITRPDGSSLRLCIYKPLDDYSNVPGMLLIHGGGYATGIAEDCEFGAKQLMDANKVVIVSPDYRQSPIAPYPAALDDCYLALTWLRDHVNELKVRSDQIMVGGESAGGGLTAALTLYNRDFGNVGIAFQMPLYMMIDDRMNTISAINNDAPMWNYKNNRDAWKLYLGKLYGTDDVPCYAAPARAIDYSNLPPTCTFVGTIEPFRDETIMYVTNLRKAGVTVFFKLYEGCFHAFDYLCPKSKVAIDAKKFKIDCFKYAVANFFKEQNNLK